MALNLLMYDGFDSYPNVLASSYGFQSRWLSNDPGGAFVGVGLVAGRFGGQAADFTEGSAFTTTYGAGYAITAQGAGVTGLALGMAFNLKRAITNFAVLNFHNTGISGTRVCGLGVNSSQQLFIWRGSVATVLATDTLALSTGAWHYIEFVASISGTVGTISVYLDGVLRPALNFTGNTGTLAIDSISFLNDSVGYTSDMFWIDDLYVASGAVRVGEARVTTLNVAANSAVTWTPLASTNASQVSEVLNDGDASYVYTTVAGNEDLYTINPLPSTPSTIYAVQPVLSCRKGDATTHTIQVSLKSGATLVHGPTDAVTGSYIYGPTIPIYVNDPNTGFPWVAAAVNAALIGMKLIS